MRLIRTSISLAAAILFSITAFSQEKLQAELLWDMGRISDVQISPDAKYILYGVTTYNLQQNTSDRNLFVMPVEGGEAVQVTNFKGGEYNGRWRPDGKKIAFLSAKEGSMQIWEVGLKGKNPKMVSSIPGGINGFEYSPDMERILFTKDVKLDKTANDIHRDLPQANARIIDDMMYRHWDSWHDYSYSHIFVGLYRDGVVEEEYWDIMSEEPYDSPMNPWGGMEQICWSPDGNKIAYTCKKLKGKDWTLSTNSEIYIYDLESESTTNISQPNEGYDQDPVFSPDGTKLVWRSMKTPGFESDKDRIMVYDFTTESVKDMSSNFDQSSANFTWSKDGETLYFISGTDATYQIYSMNIDKGGIRQITKGVHNYTSLALAGDDFIGTKMSMSMPVEIFKIDKRGKEEQLSFVNRRVLNKVEMGEVEERWINTTDGKEMLVWVIYPPQFDKKKKYPALLYCQGGPQSAVSQFWSYRWNFQMMAANDYIIVAPNRRGLPTFGQEWNDQISGDYGGQNMKDYITAIDAVAQEDFVDQARLGAVGASYGGFSVLWLAGHYPEKFGALIAHCGMFNLESQYAATEEFFFVNHDLEGPYWEDPKPKSYEFSPHKYVQNWKAPIMMITGANDFRIPYTESLQAFNAAQLRGVPSRLLYFPDESHFVLKPQNAVLWQREFFKWLDKWLKK